MSPPPPPNDRCVVLNAQPATTTFLEDGLATVQLPADSTKSLICFALTPNVFFEFSNQTGVPQSRALYNARALITIEDEVLDFGAQGSVWIVDFAAYFYGIRLYGDSKDK